MVLGPEVNYHLLAAGCYSNVRPWPGMNEIDTASPWG